jgi:hypothetical protein
MASAIRITAEGSNFTNTNEKGKPGESRGRKAKGSTAVHAHSYDSRVAEILEAERLPSK